MKKILLIVLYSMILLLVFYNILIHNIKIIDVNGGNIVIDIFGSYHNYLYVK